LYVQVEVCDSTRSFVPRPGHGVTAAGQRGGAQGVTRLEDLVDVAANDLSCRVTKEKFRRAVPRAELATLYNRVRRIGGVLQQRKQLRFKHRSPRAPLDPVAYASDVSKKTNGR